MNPAITRIDAVGITELGEGPHWEPVTQTLYYVDINGCSIHKYTPATNTHAKASIEGHPEGKVSLILPLKALANKFIIAVDRQLGIATWDGVTAAAKFDKIIEIETADRLKGNRINDGKCDSLGRIWFGSIANFENGESPRDASFYSFFNGAVKHHFGNVWISNGLTWNSANTKFYYIDSLRKSVDVFDYDLESGNITNRMVLFDLPQCGIEGLPDGMTIDTDDNLWVAVYNGSCVLHVSTKEPNTLLSKIDMPAQQITSVCFGGVNLDELYVTSAKNDPKLLPPNHGALFKITNLGCKGFKANEAVL